MFFTQKESEAAGFLARSLGGRICDAVLFPLSLFAAALLRFLYCGFSYYPQLDDYIQYHNYATSGDLPALLAQLGAFSVRPLALVTDVFVWSRFWGRMVIPLIMMAALWTAAAILLRDVFRRFFPVGNFFPLLLVLLPLNIEATYWLSASSRIVVGVFFSALSARFLIAFCETKKEKGKIRYAVLFLITNILSFCFYEQCLIFSLVLIVLLSLGSAKRAGKRAFLGAGVLLSGAVYFAVTHIFATEGVYSSRASVMIPFGRYYFQTFLPSLLPQIGTVFGKGALMTAVRGAGRGIGMIFADGAFGYALAVLALSALLGLCFRFSAVQKTAASGRGRWLALPKVSARLIGVLAGLVLAAAPLSVHFIVYNPWFSLRSAACSLPGLALAADLMLGFLLAFPRRTGGRRFWTVALAVLLSVCFICAGVSEVCDYRDCYDYDQTVVATICEAAQKENFGRERIGLLGVRAAVADEDEQNFYWHEHIHGVTESEWALSGALTQREGKPDYSVVPLPADDGVLWEAWNRESCLPDGFDRIYLLSSGTLKPLTVRQTDDGWEFRTPDGAIAAILTEDGDRGVIQFCDSVDGADGGEKIER